MCLVTLTEHITIPLHCSRQLAYTSVNAAGSVAVVKLLLDHGADASAACDAGSPVMWAAGSGKSATLEALLQGGADPNTPGNSNVTAALAASAAGKEHRKKRLLFTNSNLPSRVDAS